jgi:hypothetical protein
MTYRNYRVVADGILSIATMYLLFFFGKHSKIDMPIDALLSSPNKIRFYLTALVGGVVFGWATIHFLDMILFFLQR